MRDAFVRAAAANKDEILRHGASGNLADASLESDRADMVLTAAVRAAADLDVARRDHVDEVGTRAEVFGERAAQPARLRHRQPAALRSRAAHDIAQPASIRSAQARGDQPLIER